MKGRVIVIGASSEGIEALVRIASQLPAGFPAPLLVVQHRDRRSSGYLPAMLRRAGPLPALHPREGDVIRPGHIYVAPPDQHMRLSQGRIHLSRGPEENPTRPAIDVLFRSAALAYGPAVAGVVLAGYLSEGTAGLLAVKGRGGVAIVQNPSSAGVPSMPRRALANVPIDDVYELDEIAPRLVELVAGRIGAELVADDMRELEDRVTAGRVTPADLATLFGRASRTAIPCSRCVARRGLGARRLRYRCNCGHAVTQSSLEPSRERRRAPCPRSSRTRGVP